MQRKPKGFTETNLPYPLPFLHGLFYMPEWGSLDILEACGVSDPGSNPGSGTGAPEQSEGAHLVDWDY